MTDLTIAGETFNVSIEGDDTLPAVMLCHALGADLTLFDAQVAELLKHFRVIRYDSRGHGGSLVSDGPYSIALLGRDALAILDALGIERVHWLGISKGGAVGLWLMAHAPDRIERAVLANTAAQLGAPEAWNDRIVAALTDGMAGVADVTVQRWLSPAYVEAFPESADKIRGCLRATAPKGYAATCAALRDLDLREALHTIAQPVLVIHGRDDPSVSAAQSNLLASTIAGATLLTLDAYHMANIEASTAFTKAVVSFLIAKAPAARKTPVSAPVARQIARRAAGTRPIRQTPVAALPTKAKASAKSGAKAAKPKVAMATPVTSKAKASLATTPVKTTAKTPAKAPSKTAAKPAAKTAAKPAAKTAAKTPAKAPASRTAGKIAAKPVLSAKREGLPKIKALPKAVPKTKSLPKNRPAAKATPDAKTKSVLAKKSLPKPTPKTRKPAMITTATKPNGKVAIGAKAPAKAAKAVKARSKTASAEPKIAVLKIARSKPKTGATRAAKVKTAKAKPAKAQQARTTPVRAKPARATPVRTTPVRTKPARTKPARTEPVGRRALSRKPTPKPAGRRKA